VPAQAVTGVLALQPGQALDLPGGLRATAGGGWRALAPRDLAHQDDTPVEVPGSTPWRPAGTAVEALTPDGPVPAGQLSLGFDTGWAVPAVTADAAAVPPGGDLRLGTLPIPAGLGPLMLRHRRPGDRLVGRGGRRRLQDALVDAGVPRAARDLLPVVATADRAVWVPGVVADTEVLDAGHLAPAALLVVRRLDTDMPATGH
jgi:tRNA(Ile)-lysidine synthetase-like protein